MADMGYRSVQVSVTNDTRGDLTVQSGAVGDGDAWLVGEAPTQGGSFGQYHQAQWGVSTNDINGTAAGQIQLAGLGSWPVAIVFMNDDNGISTCSVTPNDQIKANVVQQETGEPNHSAFVVQLIPG